MSQNDEMLFSFFPLGVVVASPFDGLDLQYFLLLISS